MPRPAVARQGRENQRFNSESGARVVAGCVCLNHEKNKVVMVLSLAHKGNWVLPKGGVELDEGNDFAVSAARETWEEAGCEGRIVRKLPVVLDSRGAKAPTGVPSGTFVPKSEFHFYEMHVEEMAAKWPELDSRDRRWCTFSEAKHELIQAKRPELVQALESSSIERDQEEYV